MPQPDADGGVPDVTQVPEATEATEIRRPHHRAGDQDYAGLGAREGSARGVGNLSGRLDLMASLSPLRGTRLLDVGCGNGAYTMRLQPAFGSVVGVDIEPDRLDDFRALVTDQPVTVLQASASDLPFPDASFDAATSIETMEHLGEHRHAVMAETARLLSRGGTFWLTTPNRWWPLEQHGLVLDGVRRPGWRRPFITWVPPLHRRYSDDDAFTPRRLDRIVEQHGFRRTGLAYMWPPLDGHPGLRRWVAPLLTLASRTPLRRFAQTLVMSYERV